MKLLIRTYILLLITLCLTTYPSLSHAEDSQQDELWTVYEGLAKALGNKDVAKVKLYAHKNLASRFDNVEDMPMISRMMTVDDKSKYTIFAKDDRQAILHTDAEFSESEWGFSLDWEVIAFIKDDNRWKVLSMGMKSKSAPREIGYSKGEAQAELLKMRKDSDKDGASDAHETCEFGFPGCIKTDPNNPDTNGNGIWDGIEKTINDQF